MSEDQIKPKDWAESHGVKVDVVMKLLRDAGVTVRTHMSKVDATEYAKIEEAAAAEKQKQEARNKNLKKPASSETAEASPVAPKKKESSTVTTKTKLGLTAIVKKAPAKKAVEVIIQSPMGGNITPDEILAKVGKADKIYVRVDENKAYWVRGKETGSVDLWD